MLANFFPSQSKGLSIDTIKKARQTFVGYLRTNKHQSPIRIESLNHPKKLKKDYEYILATSKLLPNYGFPVGLDIIDKAARIPSWLGRTAKSYYLKYYLNLALQSKDPTTIISALKSISDGGRKFKNRPKAGRLPQ